MNFNVLVNKFPATTISQCIYAVKSAKLSQVKMSVMFPLFVKMPVVLLF